MKNIEILESMTLSALELASHAKWENEIRILSVRLRPAPGCPVIQASSGLALLADAAKCEITTTDKDSDAYPFESSFTYKGVRFMQIGETAEKSRE